MMHGVKCIVSVPYQKTKLNLSPSSYFIAQNNWKTNIPEIRCHILLTLLVSYSTIKGFEVGNAVKQFALWCSTELHDLLSEGLRERALLRACRRSTSVCRTPAVSWVGNNNSAAAASITPHARCLFSVTLLCLPLPNWEWMSAHRGVENNGWGQLGTLSAKHHRNSCLPEKPNMHIPLCGSLKPSNQCCCMGDNWINSQLCCQAFKWLRIVLRLLT